MWNAIRMAVLTASLPVILHGAALGSQTEPAIGKITVVAVGFGSEKGEVQIQLANSKADYDSDDAGFRTGSTKAKDGRATFVFDGVPYGEYAIKIFHDENSNRKIDIGLMGPEERYGFSNDARGVIGPPAYEKARFELAQPEKTIEIHVK